MIAQSISTLVVLIIPYAVSIYNYKQHLRWLEIKETHRNYKSQTDPKRAIMYKYMLDNMLSLWLMNNDILSYICGPTAAVDKLMKKLEKDK